MTDPEQRDGRAGVERRARMHAALGEPVRLLIVDQLVLGDASPGELRALVDLPTNLLAHHLKVLDEAGLIRRVRSEGDRRRSYVQLALDDPAVAALVGSHPPAAPTVDRVVFVCTHNSARSQLASAAWTRVSHIPATSAGTHPAPRVHPRAVRVGRRHGLRIAGARTTHVDDVVQSGDLIVAVCDNAHEELPRTEHPQLHWSVPDPAPTDTDDAFEAAYEQITQRVERLAHTFDTHPTTPLDEEPPVTGTSETNTWSTLDLDQAVALRTASTRLAQDFDGVFGPETIERFLHSSFDQFASRATVTKFLPLMAERFARQRLRALAKVEGLHDDGKPTVLFLCVHNAGRSQMAMGFFQHLAGDAAVAWSGGSEPGIEVNPVAVAAMRERGVDIAGEFPKPWTDETVRAADVVITMGCGDACPIFPGKRYEEWVLDDPAGQDLDAVRPIRDEIERRVRGLLDSLQVARR